MLVIIWEGIVLILLKSLCAFGSEWFLRLYLDAFTYFFVDGHDGTKIDSVFELRRGISLDASEWLECYPSSLMWLAWWFSLLLGDLWKWFSLLGLMGVELAATTRVLTGVEALEMPMRGCMRLLCLLWGFMPIGLRFIYISNV